MEKTKCEKSRSTSSRALQKTHARVEVYGQRAPAQRASIFNPPHWAGVHQAHEFDSLHMGTGFRVVCAFRLTSCIDSQTPLMVLAAK